MDFEKEAREIAQMVSGMPDPGCFGARDLILGALRRAYAAGQEDMQMKASEACKKVQEGFLSPEYSFGQPMASFSERFACGKCIDAILALPPDEYPIVNEFVPVATTKDIGLE